MKFSIIIPSYNRGHLIDQTLKSCLNQDYDNFEVIVIDDGGSDNTKEIVESLHDSRFKYFWKQNAERGAARNFGVEKSSGDFITFLDSDDLLYENHLSTARHIIDKNELDVFHQAYEMKDSNNTKIMEFKTKQGSINNLLVKGNFMSCMGVFLKRNVATQYKFSEVRKLSGSEDWALWLKIAQDFDIIHFPTITACMINHDERSVLQFDEQNLLNRTEQLIRELDQDDTFPKNKIKRIEAHMLTYASLHASMAGKKSKALNYLRKGISKNGSELFTRRTLAIFKKLLLQ